MIGERKKETLETIFTFAVFTDGSGGWNLKAACLKENDLMGPDEMRPVWTQNCIKIKLVKLKHDTVLEKEKAGKDTVIVDISFNTFKVSRHIVVLEDVVLLYCKCGIIGMLEFRGVFLVMAHIDFGGNIL